jgi:allantoicase
MGDGWETKRRRGPGHDWSIVKLGHQGHLRKIEVDTNHFKGNYPDNCWIDAINAPDAEISLLNWNQFEWTPVLPVSKLQAHHQHLFDVPKDKSGPWTHVRLSIAPDGGVSRLRLFGTVHSNTNVKEEAQSGAKSRK